MGHIRQPGASFFMVNEPKYVRQILVDEHPKYPKHPLLHALLEPLLGSSIFTTNGAVWERQRRLVDQGFQNARLQLVFPLMKRAVDEMLPRLDRVADGQSCEVDGEMTYITAEVMFRTILSESLDRNEAAQVYTAFLAYQRHFQKSMLLSLYRLPTFLWRPGAVRTAAKIRSPLARIIARRYEQAAQGLPNTTDILGAIMDAVDPVAGDRFTQAETLDQVCVLFLAGHETTASALAWSLYLLSHCPRIQERMREEIRAEIGARDFEFGDARKLRLTLNVFRETLRLYPPVGFFLREALESHCMRDKQIDKGAALPVSPWLIQRHRDLWDRPDEFDPDRFETGEGKESAKCAYLPFSLGPARLRRPGVRHAGSLPRPGQHRAPLPNQGRSHPCAGNGRPGHHSFR